MEPWGILLVDQKFWGGNSQTWPQQSTGFFVKMKKKVWFEKYLASSEGDGMSKSYTGLWGCRTKLP